MSSAGCLSFVMVVMSKRRICLLFTDLTPLDSSSQSITTSPQELVDEANLFLKNEDLLTNNNNTTGQLQAHSKYIFFSITRGRNIHYSLVYSFFALNRCITDAVMKTSRCPVCMTLTLQYCLFRLDLAVWIFDTNRYFYSILDSNISVQDGKRNGGQN